MEEKKKKRLMRVGLTSLCLALATPLIFTGCSNTPDGIKGPQGERGESAYEVAKRVTPDIVGNMTEAEWIASLKGDKGDAGAAGSSITKVDSEYCTNNGKPAIKFTFTMSKGEPIVSYAVVPSEFAFFGSRKVYTDLTSVLGETQNKIFNKIPAVGENETNKFTVAEVKGKIDNINDYNFYVSLGEFTEFYEIDGVRIGGKVYHADDKTSLSIGMNNFIEDKVYYIEGNELFVAAPVVFELGTDVAETNFQVFNNTGKEDAETVSTDIKFNISPSGDMNPTLSIPATGGSILKDVAASSTAGKPVYNIALKNGITPIDIAYDGKAVGDIIVTRITEGDNVRYAIDSITEASQKFQGYVAGWLDKEDWDNFTSATRTCDIMVFQKDNKVLITSYTTVATKALDIAVNSNIKNDVTTTTTAAQSLFYNKIANTTEGGKRVVIEGWEEAKQQVGESAKDFNNYVAVATIPATTDVTKVAFNQTIDSGFVEMMSLAKEQPNEFGIGNNIFVKDKAFYVEDSTTEEGKATLYVSADILETIGSITQYLTINDTIIPFEQLAVEKITLQLVGGVNHNNTITKSAGSDCEYDFTVADTNECVQFTYDGAAVGDKITIIEYSIDAETGKRNILGSGIDTYSDEWKVFFYESYSKNISEVTPKTRHYYVITPQGVASLILNITTPTE